MNELLSIIVPIYNAELYLEECIISIRKQTYENIEILLVDDGSTDASLRICERHAIEDERIVVIHQENQGRVKARKAGIEKAKGKYIGFVDSDDWVDNSMYAVLMQIAEETDADMVTSGLYKEYGETSGREVEMFAERLYETEEDLTYLYSNFLMYKDGINKGLSDSMCTKIFRREIAKEVSLAVPENIWTGEDCVFVSLYLLQCRKIYCCGRIFYHYRMRDGSTTHSSRIDYLSAINLVYIVLKKEFANSKYSDCLNKQLDKYLVKAVLTGLNSRMGLGAEAHIPWYGLNEKGLGEGRIVLYGAGAVGKDYYMQVKKKPHIELVLWIDKKYEKYRKEGYDVCKLSDINNVQYDKILIATNSKSLAEGIKKELAEKYLIAKEKMLWLEPQMLYFD